MNREHIKIFAESILAEFPTLTPDTADDLAHRIQEPAAAENALSILRNCPPEHAEHGVSIITDQMDRLHADYQMDQEMDDETEPEDRLDFGDTLWDYEEGFSDFRTQVLSLACAALSHTPSQWVSAELEVLDPWICQIDDMQLTPDLKEWQDCMDHQALWQRHILDRDYDENTAKLLGNAKNRLGTWKVDAKSDVIKVDNLIMVPIRNQAELATEAALNEPDTYPRYINKCLANTARVFTVIEDNSGRTLTLCTLRLRKGRWQVSQPTNTTTNERISQGNIETLAKFAKMYNVEPSPSSRNSK